MKGVKPLKLGEIFGPLMIALSCFCGVIINWGNWILACILGLGVAVCGTIVILDIRRAKKEQHVIK